MDFVNDVILARRSVRSYTTQQVEQEKIEQLIKACFYAPSAMNRDPRSLLVLTRREEIDKLAGCQKYCKFATGSPLAMVVCGEPKKTVSSFWVDDCAASVENILIAAKAMGIGSCWCGVHGIPLVPQKIAAAFGIPAGVKPYGIIILGYPDKENPAPPKRDIETAVHYNNW